MFVFDRVSDLGAHVDIRERETATAWHGKRQRCHVTLLRYDGPEGRVGNIVASSRSLRMVLTDILVDGFVCA